MEDKNNIEKDLQTETEELINTEVETEDLVQEEINEIEEKIYQIDLKMQELLIELEKIESQYSPEQFQELEENEQYIKLKEEYKSLSKEKKQMIKEERSKDKSKLNELSVWILIYGIIMIIISFPLVASQIWLEFANGLIDMLSGAFKGVDVDSFLYKVIVFLIIFALPLLINLVTWLLYNNLIKTKTDKKVYIGFWIAQGLMSLGMIIYMCTQLYGA